MGLENPNAVENLQMDKAFVVDPEHRPKRKHDDYSACSDQVPVIDLSPLQNLNEKPSSQINDDLIKQVGKACEEWGFFQVVNHGIPISLLDELEAVTNEFFNLPREEKLKVQRTQGNPLGYYDSELTKNIRDWKEVFDIRPRSDYNNGVKFDTGIHKNQWPSNPPTVREVCEKWSESVERLGFQVLELISQSLGLSATHFHPFYNDHTTLLRANYYPTCPHPGLALGVNRHKDQGALTVLVQDEVGGLEIRRKDGEWIGIQPRRDAFVINVGDMFQVWSNDKYQSVEHRVVVNENKPRMSFPVFFNPSYDTEVAPVPEIVGNGLPLYQEYNYGDFSKRRNDSNYKNMGVENIQIYHFAINRD